MNILPFFVGDSDKQLFAIQHELYASAVFTLFLTAYEQKERISLSRHAICTLENARSSGFDHRVLQETHDLIAARFRFLACVDLTLSGARTMSTAEAWTNFFLEQTENLCRSVDFSRDVLLAVSLANSEPGLHAERRLRFYLAWRYRLCLFRVEGVPLLPKEHGHANVGI
jgi:hypothetical protein